jgi:alpha-N-acetylglucosamine transferase
MLLFLIMYTNNGRRGGTELIVEEQREKIPLGEEQAQSVGMECVEEIREAYVTLIHAPDLLKAAQVLAYTLVNNLKTSREVVALVTIPLTHEQEARLRQAGFRHVHHVTPVPQYDESCRDYADGHGLFMYGSNENTPYAKVYAWSLFEYSKVVYMDVLVLPFVSFDELFSYPGYPLSAPVSSFPSDFFNSRLMVLTPSRVVFEHLLRGLRSNRSPDCTENGYLNTAFPYWFEERQGNSLPFHIYAESSLPWIQYRYNYETGNYTLGRSLPMWSACYMDDLVKERNMEWPWSIQKNIRERIMTTLSQFERSIPQQLEDDETVVRVPPEQPNCAGAQLSMSRATPPSMAIDEGHEYLQAYVTFIQNNEHRFIQSAQAMFYSLRKLADPRRPIVAMVTPFVTEETVNLLKRTGYTIREIDSMRHPLEDVCGRSKWNSKDGNSEVAKIRVWELEEYEKVVYIDADILVIDKIDDMFDHPGSPVLSAAPGMFPPTEFNAGVMVLTPQVNVLKSMLSTFRWYGSSDCGDQGFLNAYFRKWYTEAPAEHRLRTQYNTHFRVFTLRNLTLRNEFWKSINPKVLHFSGRSKPWIESLRINNINWSYRWNQTFTAACVHTFQSSLVSFVAKVTEPTNKIALIGFHDHDRESEMDLLKEELEIFRLAKRSVTYQCLQSDCTFESIEDAIGENGVIFIHGSAFTAQDVDYNRGDSSLERLFDLIARFQRYQKVFLPRVLTDPQEFPSEIQSEMLTWFDHRYRVLFAWLDVESYRIASDNYQALSVNLLAPSS